MKSLLKFLALGVFAVATMASCTNNERKQADERIAELERYVDSVKAVSAAEASSNWDKITADFDRKSEEVTTAVAALSEEAKAELQTKIDAAKAKYKETETSTLDYRVKQGVDKATTAIASKNPNQTLRDRFFGAGKIGEDMNFAWVNKDNILSVYQKFLQTYKDNKSSFSREDYDEIKLMYEALDARKNTVEKEGLSAGDNSKIAAIKLEFAPMFKVNRIGAKDRENSEAKQ